MTNRPDYAALAPELFKKFLEFGQLAKKGTIEKSISHLVDLRASQLNGCAFCVDMHVKEAKITGERELRLHHVAVWRESKLFSPRERAALEWTEAVTKLPAHGVPDSVYDSVREHLNEKEITDLTFLVMAINGWNRVSIAFQSVPGSKDVAWGLTKAGLS